MLVNEFGWVYDPEGEHICTPPKDLKGHYLGALWRCKACRQYWEVEYCQVPGGKRLAKISKEKAHQRLALAGVHTHGGLVVE